MHPVEERTRVDGDCPLQVAGRDGLVEIVNVARQDVRLNAQFLSSGIDPLAAKQAAKRGERLAERVSATLFVAFRPQQRDDFLATDPARACDGQQREQRQGPLAKRRSAVIAALEGQPA